MLMNFVLIKRICLPFTTYKLEKETTTVFSEWLLQGSAVIQTYAKLGK